MDIFWKLIETVFKIVGTMYRVDKERWENEYSVFQLLPKILKYVSVSSCSFLVLSLQSQSKFYVCICILI